MAFDGNPDTGWAVHADGQRLNEPKSAVFQFATPVRHAAGTRFIVRLAQQYGGGHTMGRVRLSAGTPAGGPQKLAAHERGFLAG